MPPPPYCTPAQVTGTGYTVGTWCVGTTSTQATGGNGGTTSTTTMLYATTISDLQCEMTFPITVPAGAAFTWSSLSQRRDYLAGQEQGRRDAAEAAARFRAADSRRREERRALHARAEELLLRWLSDDQRRDYRDHRRFDLTGSDGRRWRIVCRGQSGNVEVLGAGGEWVLRLCAHPPGGLPDPDAWLGQALAIVTNAAEFEAIANVHEDRRELAGRLAA